MVKSAKIPKKTVLRVVEPGPGHNEPKGQNQDEFLIHVGQILKAKAAVEAAKKPLKAARRLAQDAGYNLADMDEAIAMREQEPETVTATILRKANYATWMGLAPAFKQGDLFETEKPDETEMWFAEGREDGLMGITAKGDRYDMTVPAGQQRMRGWNAGQEVLQKRLIEIGEAAKAKAKEDKAKAAKKAEKAKTQEGETVN